MADRGWTAESARASGGSRNFKLWVPATLDKGRAAPLVLLLHGCKHNAAETAEISGMNEIADANGFLVAYPEQSRRANLLKCWNWFDPKHQTRDAGEPSILAAVVDQVCSTHNVDPDRGLRCRRFGRGCYGLHSCRHLSGYFRSCGHSCGSGIQSSHQYVRRAGGNETWRAGSGPARAACV